MPNPLKKLSYGDTSIFVSLALLLILVLGLATAAFLFGAQDKAYLLATFTEEHVRMLGMFDNRGQQMAYQIFLISTGMLAISAWYLRPHPVSPGAPNWLHNFLRHVDRNGGIYIGVIIFGLIAFQHKLQPGSSMFIVQGPYGIGFLPSVWVQLLLVVLGVLSVYCGLNWRKNLAVNNQLRSIGILFTSAIAVYAASAFFYGVLNQPDLRDFTPELLAGIEWHYAGSVASADQIALGKHIGEIAIHSGLLPSALMGYWQAVFGLLDFGGHIRFISYLQLFFFLMVTLAYVKWYSKRWLPLFIALLLVLPWVVPIHAAVIYPNQSAWRFLGLGFGTLALVYLHARPIRDVVGPLGFAAGLVLLWNLETGLALTLAYMGFVVVRASSDSENVKMGWAIPRFLMGLMAALLVFLCAVRLAFGYWVDPIGAIKSFPLLGGFSKGYGGLQLSQVDPLAALIFIHALYVLVRGLVRWGSGEPVSPRKSCEMALAGLILVWGLYYFKGPHFWNLWSYKFLYGFFIGHLLSAHWPIKPWSLAYLGRSAPLLVLALIVLPNVFTANLLTARSLSITSRAMPCAVENVVSGLCLPGELANIVKRKASVLSKLNEREDLLFLSANSYLMPLMTGINQRLQFRDPFSEAILKSDFDRLVRDILSDKPSRILFDDPESVASGYPAHRSFYGRVRVAIAEGYVKESVENGWEVWRSKSLENR